MTVSAYVDLRAGGDFRWTVTPGHHVAGTIREVEPGRRVVFGWGWEDDETLPADASTVTITIEPSAEGSLVTLEHADLPEALLAGHAEGWDHFLERLESARRDRRRRSGPLGLGAPRTSPRSSHRRQPWP